MVKSVKIHYRSGTKQLECKLHGVQNALPNMLGCIFFFLHCTTTVMGCYIPDKETSSPVKSTPKKMKVEAYKLTNEQKGLIKEDELNKKVWDEAMTSLKEGPVSIRVDFKSKLFAVLHSTTNDMFMVLVVGTLVRNVFS